ncbi:pancreatic alpha-amylase-like [Paramacrobiotus metropolitanus]|uniref:pancreatic alpha-amylase-like n=1 Tax=Paramacrobiotus metropolitanus TaxID=2943436 RepID=UPI0024459C1D|nr:pancreatic alpha-amylase-like [Paramacrobiotus metropolitanus]
MEAPLFFASALIISLSSVAFGQYDPHLASGRSVYVHLFEWKWTDIAAECERFLGPKGFGGIQVSPPNEHRTITEPFRPWYERYQPVSYKLQSRSGNEVQFADMVKRCNNAGVRIYVDAVINHMAGGSGTGVAGSSYNAGSQQYPGVPYAQDDFTGRSECSSGNGDINNYQNANEVRNCRLLGMPDLGIYKASTKSKLQGYLNNLIRIGVAGFRVDASKHMWPAHLEALFGGLNNLNTTYFPAGSRPYVFHEVIDLGGEPITGREYLGSGRVTEFKYGKYLSDGIRKENGQMLKYYRNFGEEWGFLPGMQAVTFIDNHDNQRGHGAGGSILNFRQPRAYKLANAFMLAHPYGFPQVMSSYDWPQNIQNGKDQNDWIGPPSDSSGNTNTVPLAANGACDGGWKCEHRWRQITNMVGFRNAAGSSGLVHWYDNSANQIAFGRGTEGNTKAFIAINNDGYHFGRDLMTGLPPGTYCDVISGNLENGRCSGKSIVVGPTRSARFEISNRDEDPMIAIHINAKLN